MVHVVSTFKKIEANSRTSQSTNRDDVLQEKMKGLHCSNVMFLTEMDYWLLAGDT